MGREFEPVHTVMDYWDGPRGGLAEYRGQPHVYRSIFRNDLDDWDPNLFELSPVSAEVLALALEDWAIFVRWQEAHHAGTAALETHPALPEDRSRHEELTALLDGQLAIDPHRRLVAAAEFRVRRPAPALAPGIPRPLEARWTPTESDPPAI